MNIMTWFLSLTRDLIWSVLQSANTINEEDDETAVIDANDQNGDFIKASTDRDRESWIWIMFGDTVGSTATTVRP